MKILLAFLLISSSLVAKPYLFDPDTIDNTVLRPKYRFIIFRHPTVADQEYIKRIEIAAKNLGWECLNHNERIKFAPVEKKVARSKKTIDRYSPDFMISIDPMYEPLYLPEHIPCYIHLTYGASRYFSEWNDIPEKLEKYEGVLYAFSDQNALDRLLPSHHQITPCLAWYPSSYRTSFLPPDSFNLFYISRNWDPRRTGDKIFSTICRLDENGYLKVFGLKRDWQRTSTIPQGYSGPIPLDGISILEKIHQVGVALLFHSNHHFSDGTPTSRIFESAAAGSVIITDRNPFIVREFGDSVLYLDETDSVDDLYQQIEEHLLWIRSHPEEAIQLAKKAHHIFEAKFTLESQLISLAKMYETQRKCAKIPKRPSLN